MASSKNHRAACHVLAVFLILGYCIPAQAVEFAGGKGTPDDPYQIATAEQLIAIGSQPGLSTKFYVLIADIDLSGPVWSGPVIPSLAGGLDGNGKVIRNLRIKGYGSQGLIGHLVRGAVIKNLGVEDVDVIGTQSCGALAGESLGDVANCYSTGTVICGGVYAGGLVGYSRYGTITGSYSTAEVTGYDDVGGLVGANETAISNCHSTGAVLGDIYVGGLVGNNTGEITSSYSSGDVTGGSDVGGLVGSSSGRIAFCYSTGQVTAAMSRSGGLVGYSAGNVLSSYSTASVTGQGTSLGGLVGTNSSNARIRDCFFLAPGDGGGPINSVGVPLTAAYMKLQSSYLAWDFWGPDADRWDNPWFMPADAFPVLAWQTEITGLTPIPDVAGLALDEARAVLTAAGFVPGDVSYDFCLMLSRDRVIYANPHSVAPIAGTVNLVLSSGGAYDWVANPGDGTAGNPCQVQTPGQLEALATHSELWDKCFVLTADLDMLGRTYAAPLVARDEDQPTGFQGTAFTGAFDGQSHSIRNLTIIAAIAEYAGLFGMIGPAGRISNLRLVDISVTAIGSDSYTGALAGYNEGTIEDCFASAFIAARCRHSEGLVGSDHGDIVNSYADVEIVQRSCRR